MTEEHKAMAGATLTVFCGGLLLYQFIKNVITAGIMEAHKRIEKKKQK